MFINRAQGSALPCQHLLMDGAHESLEAYLARVVPLLLERLIENPSNLHWGVLDGIDPTSTDRYTQLAKIRMAVQVRKALDKHLGEIITYGADRPVALINEVLSEPVTVKKPTWKEIGDALGVSAQAAHRKYGHSPRAWR